MEGCIEMKEVRSLIKQVNACPAQGLFAESRGAHEEILSFLESNRNLQNREKFTEAVRERLRDVNADLKSVRGFLVSSLRKKGMSDLVPALSGEILTSVKARDDFLDISSIKIHFYDGKRHRDTVDLDVVYQIGGLARIEKGPEKGNDLSDILLAEEKGKGIAKQESRWMRLAPA